MLQDYLEKSILVSSVVRSDFDFSCVFSRDIFVIYPCRHAGSVMPPRLSIIFDDPNYRSVSQVANSDEKDACI